MSGQNKTEQPNEAHTSPSELNDGLCPQQIAWEQCYNDGSGVQYAVSYDAINKHYDGCASVRIEATECAVFPITQLDWLISRLCKIREETRHNV